MARLDEIAEGLATVLELSPAPEPLPVDLRNHSQAEAAFLARAIIMACERRAVPLSVIRLAKDLGGILIKSLGETSGMLDGIKIEVDDDLAGRIELFRFPIS